MKEKLVYTTTNSFEVDYICSVLDENNIPYIKNTEGAGEYLKIVAGNLYSYTTQIYVSEKDFKKANSLIKGINFEEKDIKNVELPDELKGISEEEEKEMDEKAEKTRKHLRWFIILFMFCPIIIVVLTAIITQR